MISLMLLLQVVLPIWVTAGPLRKPSACTRCVRFSVLLWPAVLLVVVTCRT